MPARRRKSCVVRHTAGKGIPGGAKLQMASVFALLRRDELISLDYGVGGFAGLEAKVWNDAVRIIEHGGGVGAIVESTDAAGDDDASPVRACGREFPYPGVS